MYLLFAFTAYDQYGGWGDFQGQFDSIIAARKAVEQGGWDCYQIVSTKSFKIVE